MVLCRGLLKLFFFPQFGSYLGCGVEPVLVSFLDNPPKNLEGKPNNKLSYTPFYAFVWLIAFMFFWFVFPSYFCYYDVYRQPEENVLTSGTNFQLN